MIFTGARKRLAALVIALSAWAGTGIAQAETLGAPKDKPILTVSGKIAVTNKGDTAQFDRAMLEELGTTTIETTTPWDEGVIKFEGVLIRELMKKVGASGERAAIVALNDYMSEIPLEDFEKYDVILALKRNGEYMGVRDKGPLFIVYPYDTQPELKTQTYYARSVWQVARIIFK